jgi:hypothetical protein
MPILSLGEVRTGRDLEDWFFKRRSPEDWRELPYVDFEDAYAEAKREQGDDWDIRNPSTSGTQLLMYGIKAAIKDITFEPNPEVKLYRLVGSRFDAFHGADGSVEYRNARVFFDVTTQREKKYERKRPFYSDPFIIVTVAHARSNRLGQIGYYMGLQLLKKLMNQNYRQYLSDLVVQVSSGNP